MNRDKNHTLKRERNDGDPKSRWSCSCGATFGKCSVHGARKVWREHKDALTEPTPES